MQYVPLKSILFSQGKLSSGEEISKKGSPFTIKCHDTGFPYGQYHVTVASLHCDCISVCKYVFLHYVITISRFC